jgi:transcriptional regulator with XRE-family HTH domain
MSTPQRRRSDRLPQYETVAFRGIVARFTSNLRRLRESRGWTQAEAAEKCEMIPQQYQRTETGGMNLTFTTLARITEGFGVDVKELFEVAPPLAKRRRGRPKKPPPEAADTPIPPSDAEAVSRTHPK